MPFLELKRPNVHPFPFSTEISSPAEHSLKPTPVPPSHHRRAPKPEALAKGAGGALGNPTQHPNLPVASLKEKNCFQVHPGCVPGLECSTGHGRKA